MRLFVLLAPLFAVLRPTAAHAYPWMIEHAYTGCAQCHVDPSGGSALTSYGRAQSEILLRTHYGDASGESQEPGKIKDFLFGALKLPDSVIAQADARSMIIPEPGNVRFILMQADLRGGFQTKRVTGYASLGVVSDGAELAAVTKTDGGWAMVSRDYWLGVTPAKGWMIRAGRMNLPFGVRSEQHILYTRSATRTTTNDDQTVGLSALYGTKKFRTELMGIAGNFQVSPDNFRERGYAGYFAWTPQNRLELGVSSQVRAAALDTDTLQPSLRQAHGVFGRYSPAAKVGIMGEADVLVASNGTDPAELGLAAEVQADYEPTQGVHVKGGGEICDTNFGDPNAPVGTGWVAGQWFFGPRVDVRLDGMYGALYCNSTEATPMALVQFHFFL